MGYHLAMKIKATQITFLPTDEYAQWITEQDLKPWIEILKQASDREVDTGNFNYQLVGIRIASDENNGDAISQVILDIPLPKSEINKPVRDAIFSLADTYIMEVSIDNYTVEADEFGKLNKTNLDGAYTVQADG